MVTEPEILSAYRAASGDQGRYRGMDGFGDSPAMRDELLDLVLIGRKRATATLARWFEDDAEGLPRSGDLWVITDGHDRPACVIRTRQVDVMPVNEVGADFAFIEGEGDRSLDYWLTEHRKFWQREADREGFTYSDDLDVVCEQFDCVWPKPD